MSTVKAELVDSDEEIFDRGLNRWLNQVEKHGCVCQVAYAKTKCYIHAYVNYIKERCFLEYLAEEY